MVRFARSVAITNTGVTDSVKISIPRSAAVPIAMVRRTTRANPCQRSRDGHAP